MTQAPSTPGQNQHNCTILVSSCDGYSDLWKPYFKLFKRHWPDCPFPIALITEKKDPKISGVKALKLGEGLDWSTIIQHALDQIDTEYVLFTLEDFFIRKNVNTQLICKLLEDMGSEKIDTLRLSPRPKADTIIPGKAYGLISQNARYRVSTQAAFWRRETLKNLLVSGESAWQFEAMGSDRAKNQGYFVATWDHVLPYYHHVVERGKWFPWEVIRHKKSGVELDLQSRPMMSALESSRWLLKKSASLMLRKLPTPLVDNIRRIKNAI